LRHVRIIVHQKEKHKNLLFDGIRRGNIELIDKMLEFDSNHDENIPSVVLESIYNLLKKEIPSYYLLFLCITDCFSYLPASKAIAMNTDGCYEGIFESLAGETQQLIRRKVMIAKKLIDCKEKENEKEKEKEKESSYLLDYNTFEPESGLSILHKSVVYGDLEMTKLIVKVIEGKKNSGL
jgi:hypothetical protein